MRDRSDFQPIRNVIEGCWPGEWGTDPVGDQSNCIVYRATDIDDEGHLSLEAGAARVVIPAKLTAKALRKGDLLLEASGGAPDRPVGRVALVATQPGKPSLTSNFFRFMRPKANVDPTFLTFQLVALNRSSAIWRYQQQTTGLINLKVHDYLGHPVWTPSLPTQRKIATILSTIDTAIEQTEALIEKYQHIKAGLMHDLFTRGVLPNGQLRPPREQAPELYQETAVGWIPKGWDDVSLGQIANFQRGYDIVETEFEEGLFPVVSSSGIIGYHSVATTKSPNVVVGRKGTIGKVHFLERDFWAHDTSLFTTDFFNNDPRFVFHLCIRLELSRFGTKSGSPSLNRNDIHPLRVGRPPKAEQITIAKLLDIATKNLDAERRLIVALRYQKFGLMQDLLTGKVAVTVDASPSEAVA